MSRWCMSRWCVVWCVWGVVWWVMVCDGVEPYVAMVCVMCVWLVRMCGGAWCLMVVCAVWCLVCGPKTSQNKGENFSD
jgi:hypothetical protein